MNIRLLHQDAQSCTVAWDEVPGASAYRLCWSDRETDFASYKRLPTRAETSCVFRRVTDRPYRLRTEVLDAAAAPPDDEYIRSACPVHLPNACGDFLRRAVALHAHRTEAKVHLWESPAHNLQNILQGRARSGGNDTHALGQTGNLHLVRRIKQALGLQLGLKRQKTLV